jgi:hypothetical protein
MKRFHVHLHVDDLTKSIAFYSKLFASEPARVESDYAKWMLEDPRINFAISTRGAKPGVDHLGFQTDDSAELAESTRATRPAATRTARNTGLPILKASPGSTSTLSPTSPFSASARRRVSSRRRQLVVRRQPAASPSALP